MVDRARFFADGAVRESDGILSGLAKQNEGGNMNNLTAGKIILVLKLKLGN